ncbi:MAG: hypothetical protein GF398_08205 [Chitinivibrionales bacterium]|nr:hypothetical protein [Chitinivibrionales bacterium]
MSYPSSRIRKSLMILVMQGLILNVASSCSAPHKPDSHSRHERSAGVQYDSIGYPFITLASGNLSAKAYVPNDSSGYYRSSRFDWWGHIEQVRAGAHSFYGNWHGRHDPLNPEHGIGPAEEFDMESPPGYGDSAELFLKIGVGICRKPADETRYFMNRAYEIIDKGERTFAFSRSRASCTHQLDNASTGWKYRYRKSLLLSDSALRITHTLVNTGAHPLQTEHYSHNFIMLDNRPIGPGYTLELPFTIALSPKLRRKMAGFATVENSTLVIDALLDTKTLWATFDSLHHTAAENGAIVALQKSNVSLAIKGNRPLSKYNFYATHKAVCPEPFIELQVAPGDSVSWEIVHTYRVPR